MITRLISQPNQHTEIKWSFMCDCGIMIHGSGPQEGAESYCPICCTHWKTLYKVADNVVVRELRLPVTNKIIQEGHSAGVRHAIQHKDDTELVGTVIEILLGWQDNLRALHELLELDVDVTDECPYTGTKQKLWLDTFVDALLDQIKDVLKDQLHEFGKICRHDFDDGDLCSVCGCVFGDDECDDCQNGNYHTSHRKKAAQVAT